MRRCLSGIFALFLFASLARSTMLAEQPSAPPADLAQIVKQQFGSTFDVATTRPEAPVKYLHPPPEPVWVPFLETDLDGDGVPDAVIVARCKEPMGGQVEFNYKVIDPYFAAYGFGNPKITSQFSGGDPFAPNLLVVIHGAGPEAWRNPSPKAKFVVVNLPFRSIALTRVAHRKRTVPAVRLEENESMSSVIYWDGKKYKWSDVSGTN